MNEPDIKSPRLVGVGAIFIDDIVQPSGITHMGQLGGGVAHALMGAAIWDERPGICAVIGRGLPDEARSQLESQLDTQGLVQLPIPQIRAWQLFEEDGMRRELYRVVEVAPFILGAQPEHLPIEYRSSQAFYFLQGFEGMRAWREAVNGIVLWEPLQQVMIPGSRESVRDILQSYPIDILSPNLAEARAVYGDLPPEKLLNTMFDDGAQIAALRMGENGSLVGKKTLDDWYHIPAIPVSKVVDTTGAGNTYCGAFLWGIMNGLPAWEAGAAGAVAASFCIEQIGVLNLALIDPYERDRRFEKCKKNVVSRKKPTY
jgi:sugar/nucleoside kinase (ribokinase family)